MTGWNFACADWEQRLREGWSHPAWPGTRPLSAMAKAIEAAIAIACLTPLERELYKVEHNLEGLMRGDFLISYDSLLLAPFSCR